MNETIHTHDDDGDCVYVQQRPVWSFSWFDMAGVAAFLVGGVFKTVGQGLDMLGREFSAAANYERDRQTYAEQQFWYQQQQERANREMLQFLNLPDANPDEIPAAER